MGREARRVASLSRLAAERMLANMAERALDSVLAMIPLIADSDRVVEILARRGIANPTDEDILDAVEEIADEVDIEAAMSRAGIVARSTIEGALIAAKRLARREWIERLTYEEALRVAEERGLERLAYALRRWPRLSSKVIEWLRARLLD